MFFFSVKQKMSVKAKYLYNAQKPKSKTKCSEGADCFDVRIVEIA